MFRFTLTAWTIAFAFAALAGEIQLERNFISPPPEARPHTWYHMMNGNVTKEGITADFEALAKIGVGGVQMFDAGCSIPPGPLKFNSPAWFELLRHAASEARRLGLEICIPNCSGWSSSGGPWNMPSNGMKVVTWSETSAKGPSRFCARLPRDAEDNGFYEDIAVLAFPAPEEKASISGLKAKTFEERRPVRRDKLVAESDQVVARREVRDLTDLLAKDGTLAWDVPAGDWTILRVGCKCNGRRNHPASDHGVGLEVDKLSAAAMDYHFNQYVAVLCRSLGSLAGDVATGVNSILVDSYEVGSQNWTQDLDETFARRMGYSLVPYLPVFAGHVVDSVDVTERFLEDFRRVVADLFAENYAGALRKKCREFGLKLSLEPYGNCPADNLQYGACVDIPMGEFWSTAGGGNCDVGEGNARFPATVAHVWGRKFAAAESFTARPVNGGRWRTTPFSIKAQCDRVFTRGVNRIIYHRFTHQPWAGSRYLPGMTMGRWGMHFDRTQTWWDFSAGWIAYQSRCQAMLQAGTFVADVLFYCGEEAPNSGDRCGRLRIDRSMPAGYAWDVCPTDALMRLRVENGRVVVPGGVSYALLVLPFDETMSARVLAKVDELISAGAKVCGARRPARSPGLVGYPKADRDVAAAGKKVWAKGVLTCPPAKALQRLGIESDFRTAGVPQEGSGATYIHRRQGGEDWYFVAVPNSRPVSFEASFRETGRVPELWDAVSGRISDAGEWRIEDGRTVVKLDFDVSGSVFVVFRRPADGDHVVSVRAEAKPFPQVTRRKSLEIVKAEYGVFERNKVVDITERLRDAMKDGTLDVVIDNALAGEDPCRLARKYARITCRIDGKEHQLNLGSGVQLTLPASSSAEFAPAPYAVAADGRGGATVWATAPLSAELEFASGAKRRVKADVPPPQVVDGPWRVSFPHGFVPNPLAEGADETVVFETLLDWAEHPLEGVRYFSGTATYETSVTLDKATAKGLADGGRLLLDLGDVKHVAEVAVNGKTYPPFWKPPFRLDITDVSGATPLRLRIRVANLWANRLIGDDRLCEPDCEWTGKRSRAGVSEISVREIPQWVKEGGKSPTGRVTFTTWKHWDKDDALQPSGLLGPVRLFTAMPAK